VTKDYPITAIFSPSFASIQPDRRHVGGTCRYGHKAEGFRNKLFKSRTQGKMLLHHLSPYKRDER